MPPWNWLCPVWKQCSKNQDTRIADLTLALGRAQIGHLPPGFLICDENRGTGFSCSQRLLHDWRRSWMYKCLRSHRCHANMRLDYLFYNEILLMALNYIFTSHFSFSWMPDTSQWTSNTHLMSTFTHMPGTDLSGFKCGTLSELSGTVISVLMAWNWEWGRFSNG